MVVNGVRLPLSYDSQTPFLRHSGMANKNGNSFSHETVVTFSWSNVFLGKLLHKSDLIEVGPRGVRFIQQLYYDNLFEYGAMATSNECTASKMALCQVSSNEGWVLPSEGSWTPPPIFNITSQSNLLKDNVMRAFASETACHGETQGAGRAYTTSVQYSITSCDILQGKMLIVYHKQSKTVIAYPQSFGPIAYLLILLSAAVSTGGITYLTKISANGNNAIEEKQITDVSGASYISMFIIMNALSSIVVCAAVFAESKIHFHTTGDELVFWNGIWSGGFYSVIILFSLFFPDVYEQPNNKGPQSKSIIQILRRSFEIDSCVYALEIISIALYRTPENPYTSILSFYSAVRLWEKVFILCHGRNQVTFLSQNGAFHLSWLVHILRYIDLFLNLLNFNLICEVGMKPQYVSQEVWIFYFMLLVFITYCLVKYQWMIAITVF